MKEIFGFKFGGLQHKILNIVLIVFAAAIACTIGISAVKAKYLSAIVSSTRDDPI